MISLDFLFSLFVIYSFQPRPLVPYEFSYLGMADRVNAYVQNQDFCNTSHVWPDESIMQPIVAYPGSSCTKQCRSSGILVSNSGMSNSMLNLHIFLSFMLF